MTKIIREDRCHPTINTLRLVADMTFDQWSFSDTYRNGRGVTEKLYAFSSSDYEMALPCMPLRELLAVLVKIHARSIGQNVRIEFARAPAIVAWKEG